MVAGRIHGTADFKAKVGVDLTKLVNANCVVGQQLCGKLMHPNLSKGKELQTSNELGGRSKDVLLWCTKEDKWSICVLSANVQNSNLCLLQILNVYHAVSLHCMGDIDIILKTFLPSLRGYCWLIYFYYVHSVYLGIELTVVVPFNNLQTSALKHCHLKGPCHWDFYFLISKI